MAFSPDGKYALSGSWDGTARLWEVSSGEELRSFPWKSTFVTAVAFSPDSRGALAGGVDGSVLWDIATGKERTVFRGISDIVMSVAFYPDNTSILALDGKGLRLWDAASGKERKLFPERSDWVESIAFSPDGSAVLSGSADGTMKLLDLARGRVGKTFSGHTNGVISFAFSPDGKRALTGSADRTLKTWDIASGKEIGRLQVDADAVGSVAFSPDGAFALVGSSDLSASVKLWDIGTGKKMHAFSRFKADHPNSVAFSPDGKSVLSGSNDPTSKERTLVLRDAASGSEIMSTPSGHGGDVLSVAFSPDGRYALSGSGDGTLKLWDIARKKELKNFRHGSGVESAAFSPDGKYVLSAGHDAALKLWDIEGGGEVRTFTGHSREVSEVAFSPDGRYALSGSWDGTTRLWNIASGDWPAFAANPDGSQWIVFTHDGYWDSSPAGDGLLAMVRGMECWNIDQFAVRNNRPDIILRRLGSRNEILIEHYYNQYMKRLRKLGLTGEALASNYDVPEAKILEAEQEGKFLILKFSLSDPAYELKRFNIYADDVPLFGAYGKPVAGRGAVLSERVELDAGDNKIEIGAVNENAAESFRAVTHAVYDAPAEGDLYFIGFGVSTYKNSELDLNFAHKDALDLSRAFSRMDARFGNVHIHTFVNEQAIVENVKKAKALLENAKPDDTLILFIAGHGVHDVDREATYYYLTHETDPNDLRNTAAGFELIEDVLQGIAPGNKLFLMDTCESGEAEECDKDRYSAFAETRGIESRALRNERGQPAHVKPRVRTYLAERDRYIYNDLSRRSGAIVFSSCRGGEFSYESDDLRNGFFTEKILEAFERGAADADRDGSVSTDELREFVSREVAAMTADRKNPEGLQHPTVDRDNIYRKFRFPALK